MAKKRDRKSKQTKKPLINEPDYGTKELLQHHAAPKVAEHDPEGGAKMVIHRRVMTQTTINRYFHRGFITKRQHAAGQKLSSDFRLAGLDAFVSVDVMRVGNGTPSFGIPTSELAAYARQNLRKMFQSVGNGITKILTALVHDDIDLIRESAPCSGNMVQQRAALAGMVCVALEAAADYYGLPLEGRNDLR